MLRNNEKMATDRRRLFPAWTVTQQPLKEQSLSLRSRGLLTEGQPQATGVPDGQQQTYNWAQATGASHTINWWWWLREYILASAMLALTFRRESLRKREVNYKTACHVLKS